MENETNQIKESFFKRHKKLWIVLSIIMIILISFVAVTASMYINGGGIAINQNNVTNPMSSNTHRHSVTNSSNSEVFYYDNTGSINGTGNASFIYGYFNYVGSLTNKVTSGFFSYLHADAINSTTLNSTTIWEGGNRIALNTSLSVYNNLLGNQCPSGKIMNGTYANGSIVCTTISGMDYTNLVMKNDTNILTQNITLFNYTCYNPTCSAYTYWDAGIGALVTQVNP